MRPCEECAKWMYDERTGQVQKRAGQPILRPKQVPTPCHNCPKKSPEEAKRLALSPKNWRAFNFYWRVKASGGNVLMLDSVALKNCGIIEQVVAQHLAIVAAGGLARPDEPAAGRRRGK